MPARAFCSASIVLGRHIYFLVLTAAGFSCQYSQINLALVPILSIILRPTLVLALSLALVQALARLVKFFGRFESYHHLGTIECRSSSQYSARH